ncbi:hypothetical protein [Actinomadura macra]|uniref:hypothetical protein n=1 Tax=Actinomadura macra TaxID=46164 RepID=UPI0008328290|nr:hypothetical protein [Actinomadura macra]
MSTLATEEPLIPQPPATIPALRQAVAQILPASLPAFTGQLDECAEVARQGSGIAPLQRFCRQWSLEIQIHRQPHVSARLRELEDAASRGEDSRAAAAETGRILDDAFAALGWNLRP